MTKPTPGPWHVEGSNNGTPHILHGSAVPDISDQSQIVCVMPAEIARHYNSWANARLIAAAPDLLEVVKLALACEPDDWRMWHQQARNALAKATQPSTPVGEANPNRPSESGA